MATAEAAVCNVALARIGHTQFIEALNDTTVVSKTCKALFAFNRDQLLQSRPWPFATLRKALTVAPATEIRTGWAYVYTLPPDCIAPRYIYPGIESPGKGQEIPFRIESSRDLQARVLLTNYEDAELVYTARITEPPRWDSLFAEALAMKLASDLAFGLAKKPVLGRELLIAYHQALAQAHASAANQNTPSAQPYSEFELGRR